MYTVVKNNKTPNGPISVGDVNISIIVKTASPIMLKIAIMRLCFITSIISQLVVAPKFLGRVGVIRCLKS